MWPKTATAQDDQWRNDSYVSGQPLEFYHGLGSGDIAVAALQTYGAGTGQKVLTGVQFAFGGRAETRTVTIHIWAAGASGLLHPADELYTEDFEITGSDSMLQDIELSNAIWIPWHFFVGIELHHSGLPSIATDQDGITAGNNLSYSDALGWFDGALGGLHGDWIIRAKTGPTPAFFAVQNFSDYVEATPPTPITGDIVASRFVPQFSYPSVYKFLSMQFYRSEVEYGEPIELYIWADAPDGASPGELLWTLNTQTQYLWPGYADWEYFESEDASCIIRGPFWIGCTVTVIA